MSKIKVVSQCAIYDGMSITFRAPCNSDAMDGINVYHNGVKNTFTLRDANGVAFSGKSNLFATGAYVKVVLDTTNKYAYLQNAATSKHASQHAKDGSDPITPQDIGAAVTETITVSVPVSWTADSANGGYYQAIAVDGILAEDTPIVDIILGSNISSNTQAKAAWELIDRITTAANSITLYANKSAPATAFTFQMKVVR